MEITEDTLRKFFARIEIVDDLNSCWLWKGPSRPYGSFSGFLAHRFMYQFVILGGFKIPKELYVCHRCDIKSCVRPEHLFLGSQKDNMQDASRKGRIFHPIGDLCGNSRLNWPLIRVIRQMYQQGHRQCYLCRVFQINSSLMSSIVNNKIWEE